MSKKNNMLKITLFTKFLRFLILFPLDDYAERFIDLFAFTASCLREIKSHALQLDVTVPARCMCIVWRKQIHMHMTIIYPTRGRKKIESKSRPQAELLSIMQLVYIHGKYRHVVAKPYGENATALVCKTADQRRGIESVTFAEISLSLYIHIHVYLIALEDIRVRTAACIKKFPRCLGCGFCGK